MKKILIGSGFFLAALLMGCGGGGGGSSTPVKPTPLAVAASSYANKNDVLLDLPQLRAITANGGSSVAESVTFGDFFQDGTLSAFVVVSQPNANGVAYFLSKNASGIWEDKTSINIISDADRNVCPTVSQSITADFNKDGKPDIYVSCRGAGGAGAVPQVLYLSNSGSVSYRKMVTPFSLYAWGVAAADIDADASHTIDIVTSNWDTGNFGFAHVLLGALDSSGNFTLTQDSTKIPHGVSGIPTKVSSVHLIPVSGALPDLVMGGEASNGNPVLWMRNDASGGFSVTGSQMFTKFDAVTFLGGTVRGELHDVVKSGNYLYALMKDSSMLNMALVKYGYPSGQASASPITSTSLQSSTQTTDLVNQIKLNSQGYFVAFDGACTYLSSDASYSNSRCGWRIAAP